MTTLTTRTGTISSAGIGSGLDVNSIVTSLMAVERKPLERLQSTAGTLQTTLSAFGQMQSLVSALQEAARPLYKADNFKLANASSSDATAVGAATSGSAVPGVYSISVSALASAQSVASAAGQFADPAAVVGTGSLTIRLGAWNAGRTAFTPKAGSLDIVVPIGADANTLAAVRDKINAAAAGVSASIVTDASGSRLALNSTTTGAVNGFRVTVADDDGTNDDATGLSRLAYDPAAGATPMVFAQAAGDTQATVNGIAVSTASTTLDSVVDGLTLNLAKVTTQPVTVNVTRNTDAIKAFVTSFVTAFNALNGFLAGATQYDAATKQGALLQGDGTTTGIHNQLRGLVSQKTGASTVFSTLSSIGVQLQKDGTLKVDDAALGRAVANLPELTKALSALDTGTPANNGFGKRFAAWADTLLASGGALAGKTTSIQARIASNQKEQAAMSDRLEGIEQRLRSQYTTLDATMSKAAALAKYVELQFYTLKQQANEN